MVRENQDPVNLAGVEFFEIEKISVHEFHELSEGLPSQVHLWFTVAGTPYPYVVRFKSGRGIDELIVALMTHRKAVFG